MRCHRIHNNRYPLRFATAAHRRQRGAALVVALLIFAVAAALMVGLQRDFTLHMQRSANNFVQEQSWEYLLGAEDLAAMALRLDVDEDSITESPKDNLTELWAQESSPYPLDGGGWLSGRLEDLQGRFNLNNLVSNIAAGTDEDDATETGAGGAESASQEEPRSPSQQQFIRLLQVLEGEDVALTQQEAIAMTEVICDFMDGDNEPRPQGAEADNYRNLTPPYYPANQALMSISELRAVRGMTEEVFRALAPLVTVWPSAGTELNVLTASLPMLRSLVLGDSLEPLSLIDGEFLWEAREEGRWDTIETLFAQPIFAGQDISSIEPLLTQRSDWFLLDAQVEIADREQHLYSVLERQQRKITARYRSLGAL